MAESNSADGDGPRPDTTPAAPAASAQEGSTTAAPGAADAGAGRGAGADVPTLLPARMLNEYAYCPRLFHLEWVQGEFRDSADTVDGRWKHRNVDTPGGKLDGGAPKDGEVVHARSLALSSDRLGVIAVIDVVEADGRRATPIDYKRGEVPDGGPWEPERVQVCVQALLLREHGYECDEAAIWFVGSRRRVPVPIDDALVARTLELLAAARAQAAGGAIPPPLVGSPKCPRCSLNSICLPDETLAAAAAPEARLDDVRRLYPARDPARPVYVQEQGAKVGIEGERLVVRSQEGATKVRLIDVSHLCVIGNVQVSTQAIRELAGRGVPTCYFSYGGWFAAATTGAHHKNIDLRLAQFRAAEDPARSLAVARRIVAGKVKNQRTLLRRNHPSPDAGTLAELARLAASAGRAPGAATLLGIEGAAARAYFQAFPALLRSGEAWAFDFEGRNRRPPKDRVNAMLSFVYSLLVKDALATLVSVGFDPYLGVYHRPRYGRPALALDLAEEFRPLVGDSVVIGLINNDEIRADEFVVRGDAVALDARGRRKVLRAYERRMEVLVRHPLFGYTVSYRRLLELQARLLGRHLLGELPHYPPFRTR